MFQVECCLFFLKVHPLYIKSVFLSALSAFKTSCTLQGQKVRIELMQKLPSWSEYLGDNSNAVRSAVDFLLPLGK